MIITNFEKIYIGKLNPIDAYKEINVGNKELELVVINTPKGRHPIHEADEIIHFDKKNDKNYCITIERSYLQQLKKLNPNVKGKRNIKAYLFVGWVEYKGAK